MTFVLKQAKNYSSCRSNVQAIVYLPPFNTRLRSYLGYKQCRTETLLAMEHRRKIGQIVSAFV